MNKQTATCKIVRGTVKWFDPGKGFGFVLSNEGGPDILLHSNVLRNFGQSSVVDGARIEIAAQQTARGMQAIEVVSVEPPLSDPTALLEDEALLEITSDEPLKPARVKWFDKTKGFGFANVFGDTADIFIHAEVLRRSGFAELQPGEAVCLKIGHGKRGLMATWVAAWDVAAEDTDAE